MNNKNNNRQTMILTVKTFSQPYNHILKDENANFKQTNYFSLKLEFFFFLFFSFDMKWAM